MKRRYSYRSKLAREEVVEITRDVGPIPAGTYIYKGKSDGFMYFDLPGCAHFGIESSCKDACRRVSRAEISPLSKAEDFLKSYYDNMHRLAFLSYTKAPLTFCAVIAGESVEGETLH